MLILTRKKGERIFIGQNIVIEILGRSGGDRVQLGITAPEEVAIQREEVAKRMIQRRRGTSAQIDSNDLSRVAERCSS
jgi:carbon storage regulator